MIRLATAFGGASQVVSGLGATAAALGMSFPLADPSRSSSAGSASSAAGIVTLVLVIVLGVVGYIYQARRDAGA